MECSACADRPPLCPRCRDRRFQWHSGQARVIGMAWGDRLRRLMPDRSWPAFETSDRVQHITRKKVRGRAFLDVVPPQWALVSSGPKKYGTVTLPDNGVLDMLKDVGAEIVRTDVNDKGCPEEDKVGENDTATKKRPGGCDSYVIDIAPSQ